MDTIDQTSNAAARLRELALTALEALLLDNSTPHATRASAIRTALELVGLIGRSAQGLEAAADPESMTAADIDRAIAELSAR